ncbi:uncharacterized protein ARB_03414 [Trichophyton benhamiae CBS 112371]|uniref:Oxo-4-hydroxy-4-carboxy-5-ureidoimidazoline decarboxylase domain-containing protein n=1 Tax=Arthroderma benhamiae (strain ATCC MYA-4681 / CBS 112371) TaxID=663331 RepID=D4B4M4_ARTBC|nr:uncharacterized protein ARB_03414 [Trichophyton benhamiae CBS 112371]EFE30072.1 conserved hypothetical protein [Trichophyton benhamiae CBS 112371]
MDVHHHRSSALDKIDKIFGCTSSSEEKRPKGRDDVYIPSTLVPEQYSVQYTMASQDTLKSAQPLPLEAASIASSSPAEQIAVLDILFEPSQNLHNLALPLLQTPFNSYRELIDRVRAELHQLAERAASDDTDKKILYDILGSHPRLGAPKSSHLSEFSRREQSNLATVTSPGQGAGDEADRLRKLNEEYERTFPGLRYVVFVCGRGRDVIMEDMRRRIDAADVSSEIDTTITEHTRPLYKVYKYMITLPLTLTFHPLLSSLPPRVGFSRFEI